MTTRGSISYIWSVHNQGRGSEKINSYVGRVKRSGKEVFLKEVPTMINEDYLRNVDSKNIVKFYKAEDDSKTGFRVFAFEYCEEGSVYDLLQRPENLHGFEGEVVLQCCADVVTGLSYLKERNYLHEKFSLLPSNVVCKKHDDGSLVFKLAEFYYQEYNVYKSPYQIYVIEKKYTKAILQFSLAFLLIQMITGRNMFERRKIDLDFFKRRKKNEICVDFDENWTDNFPLYCQIDSTTKQLFKEIIDKLLNFNEICDLKTLKKYLTNELEGTLFYFFDISSFETSSLRLKSSDKVSKFKKYLKLDFSLDKLFFNHSILKPSDSLGPLQHRCTRSLPILILRNHTSLINSEKEVVNPSQQISSQLERLYNIEIFPIDPSSDECQGDATVSRTFCAFIGLLSRIQGRFRLARDLLDQVLSTVEDEVVVNFQICSVKFEVFTFLTDSKNFSDFKSIQTKLSEINDLIRGFEAANINVASSNDDTISITSYNDDKTSLTNELKSFSSQQSFSGATCSEIPSTTCSEIPSTTCSEIPSTTSFECGKVLNELLKSSLEIHETFMKDSPTSLSHNERQIHRYMKVKLKEDVEESSRIFIEYLSNSDAKQRQTNHQLNHHYKLIQTKIMQATETIQSSMFDHLSKNQSNKGVDFHSSTDSGFFSTSSTTCKPITKGHYRLNNLVSIISDRIDDLEEIVDRRNDLLSLLGTKFES